MGLEDRALGEMALGLLKTQHNKKKRIWGGSCFTGSSDAMSVLSQSCRWLGNPRSIQFVTEFVACKSPKFIFLCETLSQKRGVRQVTTLVGFRWSRSCGPSGKEWWYLFNVEM